MMDFSRSSTHKAKKPHKCFLCGGKIAIGEKYERYTGKYDGDFFDQCFHENCIAILDKFCRDQQDEEYQQDWVADWLYERVCNDCKKKEHCEENVFRCKNVLFVMLDKEALKDDSATD